MLFYLSFRMGMVTVENTQVGPFQILRKLGAHRRHNVYHARQVEQDRDVAIKFITLPPDVDRAAALDKINREVQVLRHLSHPRLIRMYGAGVEDDKIFFAYELVDGETLASLLARRGRLAPDQVMEYARQIAELLDYLHDQEIIHSKLTTEKILIQFDGQVRVADLRLNRSKKRRWDAGRKNQLEIAAYMAPEQFTEHGATTKSDFYALGVIMFEMLTGRLPHEPDTLQRMAQKKKHLAAPSVTQFAMNCPVWLDKFVSQLLSADPKMRPHSAQAIVMALDEIKKIDLTRITAAEEMTRGFNPLTAGRDKTEAKKVLGVKEEKPDGLPIYQRSIFLIAALAVIFGIFAWALMPTSSKSLYQSAEVLMESDNHRDWQRARALLKRIMERGPSDDYSQQATDLYYKSRRRSLLNRAESGLVGLESINLRRFITAYNKEKQGETEEAVGIYRTLVETIDPGGDQRHIHIEAKERLESLSEGDREAAAMEEKVVQMIEDARQLEEDSDLAGATKIYQEIIDLYGSKAQLRKHVDFALDKLTELSDD